MPMVPSAVASAANDGGALDVTKGGPAPSSAGLVAEVAKINNAFDGRIDQADAKIAADDVEKKLEIERLDHDKAQSVEARFSSPEKDNGVPKPSLSNFTMSEDKNDIRVPNTPNANMGDMKIPIPGKPRMAMNRQAASHTPVKQASLENRNTSACSGSHSCSGDMPRLFGVGF